MEYKYIRTQDYTLPHQYFSLFLSLTINCTTVAVSTEGYSGADIKLLCKEAAMRPIRSLLAELDTIETTEKCASKPSTTITNALMQKYPIQAQHLKQSRTCTKSSTCVELCDKYNYWNQEYGST